MFGYQSLPRYSLSFIIIILSQCIADDAYPQLCNSRWQHQNLQPTCTTVQQHLADQPARPPAGPPTAARTTNAHTTHTHPPCLDWLAAPRFFFSHGASLPLLCSPPSPPAQAPSPHLLPLPSVLLSHSFFSSTNASFFLFLSRTVALLIHHYALSVILISFSAVFRFLSLFPGYHYILFRLPHTIETPRTPNPTFWPRPYHQSR